MLHRSIPSFCIFLNMDKDNCNSLKLQFLLENIFFYKNTACIVIFVKHIIFLNNNYNLKLMSGSTGFPVLAVLCLPSNTRQHMSLFNYGYMTIINRLGVMEGDR